ncbi:hypothetical protein SSX86_022693 [Deinandra increscens subsp. villosa]|uniref:Ubiquitin-like protease family profile domain-containing protein n=1 Tax=Deinandra increscens subsp. villosa TaxID=3103831 RepID=A0AAP0GRL9_9ASTR
MDHQYSSQPNRNSDLIRPLWRFSKKNLSSSSGCSERNEDIEEVEPRVYAQEKLIAKPPTEPLAKRRRWAIPDDECDNWSKDVLEFYNNGDQPYCYSALFFQEIKLDKSFWGPLLGYGPLSTIHIEGWVGRLMQWRHRQLMGDPKLKLRWTILPPRFYEHLVDSCHKNAISYCSGKVKPFPSILEVDYVFLPVCLEANMWALFRLDMRSLKLLIYYPQEIDGEKYRRSVHPKFTRMNVYFTYLLVKLGYWKKVKTVENVLIYDDNQEFIQSNNNVKNNEALYVCMLMEHLVSGKPIDRDTDFKVSWFKGSQETCKIDEVLLELVERFEDWNIYEWGEYLWDLTYPKVRNILSRKKAARAERDKARKGKAHVGNKEVPVFQYSAAGFLYPLKMWILETFPELLRRRERDYVPKIPRCLGPRTCPIITWADAVEMMTRADNNPEFLPCLLSPTIEEGRQVWWRLSFLAICGTEWKQEDPTCEAGPSEPVYQEDFVGGSIFREEIVIPAGVEEDVSFMLQGDMFLGEVPQTEKEMQMEVVIRTLREHTYSLNQIMSKLEGLKMQSADGASATTPSTSKKNVVEERTGSSNGGNIQEDPLLLEAGTKWRTPGDLGKAPERPVTDGVTDVYHTPTGAVNTVAHDYGDLVRCLDFTLIDEDEAVEDEEGRPKRRRKLGPACLSPYVTYQLKRRVNITDPSDNEIVRFSKTGQTTKLSLTNGVEVGPEFWTRLLKVNCDSGWLMDDHIWAWSNYLYYSRKPRERWSILPPWFHNTKLIKSLGDGTEEPYPSILETDVVYVPVNMCAHWYLVAFDLLHWTYTVYDSLETPNTSTFVTDYTKELVYRFSHWLWFFDFYTARGKTTEFEEFSRIYEDVPQQVGTSDCGVWLCMFLERLTSYESVKQKNEDQMDDPLQYRRKMAKVFYEHRLAE